MSQDSIYIRFKGKTLGPMTSDKVRGLVSRGQITRMHELSSDGMTWFRAEEFGDFFRARHGSGESGGAGTSGPETRVNVETTKQLAQVDTVEWYANVGGEARGPMNKNALLSMIEDEEVVSHTLVWRTGLDDWQEAENLFPERFRQKAPQGINGSNSGSRSTEMQLVSNALVGSRGWVMFIAIATMLLASLSILNAVFLLITSRGYAALIGIGNLVGGILYLYGGILLLQYGNSLKIPIAERQVNVVAAVKRLSIFWSYVGIVLAILLIVGVVGGVVFALIGSAAISN